MFSPPEEIEREARKLLKEGKIKDGITLLVRAAKKYEESGKPREAATLYKEAALLLTHNFGLKKQARPLMVRAAYLYVKLLERELDRSEVSLERLTGLSLNVIEAFTFLEDKEHVRKYATEFANLYADLGANYEEAEEIESAIVAYEASYRYYDLLGDKEGVKKIASRLVEIFSRIAEEAVANEDYVKSGETFEKVGNYIKSIFGYDERYTELMETAGKHYEKASKLAYAEGDLETMATLLLRAQYAYLLARNFNRANLIGINLVKILNQVIDTLRATERYRDAGDKLMELAEALIGIGRFENAMKAYKEALYESEGKVYFRARIRMAIVKYLAAKEKSLEYLKALDAIEFLMMHNRFLEVIDLAEKIIKKHEEGDRILKMLYEAEGYHLE
ncbi:hypothetical protein PF1915 [Pyrococcus furiosus DSM 3638]|nr:hypothetical protein PF1915 [Pyrococcus furiosus DSM 3638]MDK2870600.1 hypothetical protein [Pyrococcus sp.]